LIASEVSPTIKRDYGKGYGDGEIGGGLIASTGSISHSLNAGGMGRQDYETETLIAHTLEARNKVQAVARATVRRLTPKECERLQGFPDDYTQISWRGASLVDCPDRPRYKALGNSMAVPCLLWIGHRIQATECSYGGNDLA
jgi:DNA (cytosine-5)-methyltransferase 1